MPLTSSTRVLAQAVYDLVVANKVSLGLADIWYGDEDKTPRTPCVVIESGEKTRSLNAAPRRVEVTFNIYVMIYHAKLGDTQVTREQVEQLAEDVEAVLHADATIGGLVIHSLVALNEPGYASRGGALMKASRLTLQAISNQMLPYPSL